MGEYRSRYPHDEELLAAAVVSWCTCRRRRSDHGKFAQAATINTQAKGSTQAPKTQIAN